MTMIDLRSDTVTKPTAAMRQAMASADVGDDVYGEDPTVNRLEAMAAELLGKEAGLFVPTGVMGNQLAIRLHTQPGDEVIIEGSAHILRYVVMSAPFLSGVLLWPVPGKPGLLSIEGVEMACRRPDLHTPSTTLLCLEQTHNVGGGSIYSLATIHQLTDLARSHGLALHLDGARLFNASAKTGVAVAEYAAFFDTVSFCLSKGLGAPVGSIVVSDEARIQKLRRLRKLFGGGMRQVGILAAAGIYALENHVSRLVDDHANAMRLAQLLREIPGVLVDMESVETNMVMFQVPQSSKSTEHILEDCRDAGVLLNAVGDRCFRLVTHLDVNQQDMEVAGKVFAEVFASL